MFSAIPEKDGFNGRQVEALSEGLDKSKVRIRFQPGGETASIDGWWVICEANRIFGFGNWDRRTEEMILVQEREIEGPYGEKVFHITYLTKVAITVQPPHAEENVIREASGAGHCSSMNLGEAHEVAAKMAEMDGMKNALMTFGFPFGLGLVSEFTRTAGFVENASEPVSAARNGAADPTSGEPQQYNTLEGRNG